MSLFKMVRKLAQAAEHLEQMNASQDSTIQSMGQVNAQLEKSAADLREQLGKMAQAGQVLIGLGYAFENGKWAPPAAEAKPDPDYGEPETKQSYVSKKILPTATTPGEDK